MARPENLIEILGEEQGHIFANNNDGNQELSGPFPLLDFAIRCNTKIIVKLRNRHWLFGRLVTYDHHMNLLMRNVIEFWLTPEGEIKPGRTNNLVKKERFIKNLLLRGDNIIFIMADGERAADLTFIKYAYKY